MWIKGAYVGARIGAYIAAQGIKYTDPAFKITIDTTKAGSDNNTFVLPLRSGKVYDFKLKTSGQTINHTSDSDLTITYTEPGVHKISITGVFPGVYFNNTGDKEKLISWDNLGSTGLSTIQDRAFWGCNLESLPGDNIEYWGTLINGDYMFTANMITTLPDSMTLSSLINGDYMFLGNMITTLPDSMTLSSLINGAYMFLGNTINTEDYSNLLIRTEANNSNNDVSFHGGNSKYNNDGKVARDALVNDHSWVITDGGLE